MPIPQYHYYHGAALSIITEPGEFTGLARTPVYGAGAYAVNHNIGIFIKHTTHEDSPFHFTFSPEHQTGIRDMFRRYGDRTFVVLVCCEVGICVLSYGEYAAVIDENFNEQEGITVERPDGGGFRVRGAQGELPHVIPLNRFPTLIFEA